MRAARDETPQPEDADSGYGSSAQRVGSGVTSHSTDSSVVWASLNEDQKEMVELMMNRMAAEHGFELETLQETFGKMEAREAQRREDNTVLASRVSELTASLKGDESQGQLDVSREHSAQLKNERDDIVDSMAGMEALHAARTDRLQQDLADLRAAHLLANELAASTKTDLAEVNAKKLAELRSELQAAQASNTAMQSRLTNAEEAGVEQNDADVLKLANVQALLDSARKEIARRDANDLSMDRKTDSGKSLNATKARELEDLLFTQGQNNSVLTASLTAKRLDLLNLQQEHKKETDNLKSMLLAAQNPQVLPKARAHASKKAKGDKSDKLLPSIDEGFDMDEVGSQAASAITCGVSSEGLEVANLADFDDPGGDASGSAPSGAQAANLTLIAQLRDELVAAKLENTKLVETGLGQDAKINSKLARLLRQRDDAQSEHASQLVALMQLTQGFDLANDKHLETILSLETALEIMREDKDADDKLQAQRLNDQAFVHSTDLEEIQQRLAYAVEHKRLMDLRLADMKRELINQEERNVTLAASFEAKLNNPDEIQALEESRNVILNKLESQSVHYDALLEYANTRLSQETAQLEAAQHALLKHKESNKELVAAIANAKEALKKKNLSADINDNLGLPIEGNPYVAKTTVRASASAKASQPVLSSLLGCPLRYSQESGTELRCLWQIITTLQGYVVLLCQGENFEITDASKEACSVWGSSELWGSTLTSLFANQVNTSWFTKKVANISKDNGCSFVGVVGVRTRDKSVVDYSVLCAKFDLGKQESIIFIFEAEETNESHMKDAKQRWSRGASSSVSEDVQACDSISNVLEPM